MEFTDLDLADVDSTQPTYLDCSLSKLKLGAVGSSVKLTDARFSGTRFEDCRADTWTLPRGNIVHLYITETRIGAGLCHNSVNEDFAVIRALAKSW